MSSLPLGDLEIGVKWLRDNVNFEDEEEALFKEYFMEYIDSYWVNGVFPPFVWSTWKRTGDYTNNNQEGFNFRINWGEWNQLNQQIQTLAQNLFS